MRIAATALRISRLPVLLPPSLPPPAAAAMVVVHKKHTLKLGRALKTAARLPARVSGGRGSGRNTFSPAAGELPVVLLRVQVRGCRDLVTKDKSGLCDP